jgi:glutamine---fructose-6-phosphate transaminase (isomerizing)
MISAAILIYQHCSCDAMCGIIGYSGKKNANLVVLEGLKDLEYRGYDSWGIASLDDTQNSIQIVKNVGKVSTVLLDQLHLPPSSLAIGHTRWSTHGGVTQLNAHPHFAQNETFALVQNGIVENYQELRLVLKKNEHVFETDTDTEVIVRLIEEKSKSNVDLKDAVIDAFKELKGRNGIVVIEKATKRIIGVRNGSPLLLGIGEDEFIVASDPSPVLRHTNNIVFLDDNECVVVHNGFKIYSVADKKELHKKVETIDWTPEQARKGEHDHFMIKEILEQRHTIEQALVQDPELIKKIADAINNAVGVYAVGCGTAGKVCLAGEYVFSKIAKKHINFAFGSEFPNFHHFITSKTLMLVVSQSGETADTLEAMKIVLNKGGNVISLVNVMGSSIMRKSTYSVLLNAGPEVSVCSTKATTAQITLMILLAYSSAGRYAEGLQLLQKVARDIKTMLVDSYLGMIKGLAQELNSRQNIYIIGRGINYPMALEAAIKLQEVSYIHAEGFAGGELKHGPIALIEQGTPCIVLVANDETKHHILSNAMEIKSRGGYIIGIAPENNEVFNVHIAVPDSGIASPIVNIIPIQLLAYYLAVLRGNDVDRPRNLAKSVVVV